MSRFTAIINCVDPLDDDGVPRYLRWVCGTPILAILAQRIACLDLGQSVMVMHQPEKHTEAMAQSLKWTVFSLKRPGRGWIAPLLKLLQGRYWVFFDPVFPFIDPDESRKILALMTTHRLRMLRVRDGAQVLPQALMRLDTALLAIIKRWWQKGSQGFFAAARDLTQARGYREKSLSIPAWMSCLHLDTLHSDLVAYLGGLDLSLQSLQARDADPAFDRKRALELASDRLCRQRERSRVPYRWNLRLNHFESRQQLATVKSYPLDVALNLTTICNARCRFCSYPAMRRQTHHYFTLNEIRTWTWPQYIKKMGFGGGIGEPLAHPQFLDIFRYVTAAYPHLATRVITNGIGLNRDICEAFAGRLARLRVSLNAATPSTWERLMGRRGFEPVCEHIASLSALKSRLNTDKPEIYLLMVINEHNIHEAAAFARLAAQVGAQVVTYNHFIPSVMQCKLPPRASLYYDQERCDQEIERAAQQATALGLLVERPPAFRAACGYFEAGRVEHAPEQCLAPWQICLLAVDDGCRRQMSVCCVGLDTRISYDHSDLTAKNFLRLWNHPTLRYFRETVNQGGSNPICGFCRTQDRDDPDNLEVYRIQAQIDPLYERLQAGYRKTGLDGG